MIIAAAAAQAGPGRCPDAKRNRYTPCHPRRASGAINRGAVVVGGGGSFPAAKPVEARLAAAVAVAPCFSRSEYSCMRAAKYHRSGFGARDEAQRESSSAAELARTMFCCGGSASKYHLVEAAEVDPYAAQGAASGTRVPQGPPDEPTGDVELSIECTNLKSFDLTSKSDPLVVAWARDDNGAWRELGRTEVKMEEQNPKFVKSFELPYFFERTQWLRFDVYDADESHSDLARHDFVGTSGEVRLCDIVAADRSRRGYPLLEKKQLAAVASIAAGKPTSSKLGSVIVIAEEMKGTSRSAKFSLRAEGLANKDGFLCCGGRSDPFVAVSRFHKGAWVRCHSSPHVMNDLNPRWQDFSIPTRKLNGNDPLEGGKDRSILFEVYDWDADGSHDKIGFVAAQLSQLVTEDGQPVALKLQHPTRGGQSHGVGTLIFDSVTVSELPTFMDFVKGGCELGLMTAIDFTGSNGQPDRRDSLHYQPLDGRPNDYQSALRSVGEIVCAYDHDGKVPALGNTNIYPFTLSRANHTCPDMFKPKGTLALPRKLAIVARKHTPNPKTSDQPA